jgi:hypothetical protein
VNTTYSDSIIIIIIIIIIISISISISISIIISINLWPLMRRHYAVDQDRDTGIDKSKTLRMFTCIQSYSQSVV